MATDPQQLPPVHEAWLPREHSLHRPRHGGRQLAALICALLFFATPTALWVIGMRPEEIDNRKLTGFPRADQGWGMFTGLPDWANDQLVFRGSAVSAADGISRNVFGEPPPIDNGRKSGGGPLPNQQAPGTGPGEKEQGGGPGSRRVIEGSDGWLYLGLDVSGKCSPERAPAKTVRLLERMRQAVESSGRRFVVVVAPDKTTMVPQHLPESYAGKECAREATAKLWPLLIDKAGALDLRPALDKAGDHLGKPPYSPNDTHWTDEGAVMMARSLAEAVRPGRTESWQVEAAGTYSSSADLPPMLGKSGTKTNTRYRVQPDGVTDRTGLVATDIDKPLRRQSTPIPGTVDDRTVIYGDSFTKAASGYLSAAFTDLTMQSYVAAGGDTDQTIQRFIQSDIVILQLVERSVAAGSTGFINAGFVKRLQPKLAANPR